MNAASLPFDDALSDITYWHGHKCWPLQEALVAGVPYVPSNHRPAVGLRGGCVNPVILVRWYYLGWQGCENMKVVKILKDGTPNLGGFYRPESWVEWASQ